MADLRPAIQLQNLSRSYQSKDVFKKLNAEIMEGEAVLLTGVNGAGKTTLLKVLATLLLPSSGEVFIHGLSVRSEARSVKKVTGLSLATDGGFFPTFTGSENLYLFASLRGINRNNVDLFLEGWRSLPVVQEALKTRYFMSSAGMKEILAFLRCLIHEPRVVLLDEPMRNLDFETKRAFLEEVLRLKKRKTAILIASHSEEFDSAVIDRKLTLTEGQLACS